MAAARAKEEYQRRHMAGETEQAKRELAQLAIVRARREEARKKREAEGRAPGMSATGLAEDVYKGGQIIVDAAGNIVDATMAMHYGLNPQTDYDKFVRVQPGTQIPVQPTAQIPVPVHFKNKKSTSKSLYKKKNVKSPKSVKNNRKKKSPLRKKKSLLKRKL